MGFTCFAFTSCDDGMSTTDDSQESKKKLDDSYGIIIRDLEFSIPTDASGSTQDIKLDLFELYIAEDKDGKLIGGGTGTAKIPTSYQGFTTNMEMKASLYIENDVAYVYLSQTALGATQAVVYTYDADKMLNSILKQEGTSLDELKAQLEGYGDIDSLVENWINDTLIPSIGDIDDLLPSDDEIESVKGEIKDFLETFIIREASKAHTNLTINYATIKGWNAILGSYTVDELCDYLLGEGAFDSIESAVPGILSLSVADLVDMFLENGGDISDLVDAFDSMLPLMGAPDGATLESLLTDAGIIADGDSIEDVLTADEMEDMTVALLLVTAFGFDDAYDLDYAIDDLFYNLSRMTVYQLAGIGDEVAEEIDAYIDAISEYLDFTVVLDMGGKIKEIKAELSVEQYGQRAIYASIDAKIYDKKIDAKFEIDVPSSASGSFSIELVKEHRGFYNAKELKEIKKDVEKAEKAGSADNLLEALCEYYGADVEDCELIYDGKKLVGAVLDSSYVGLVKVDLVDIWSISIIGGEEGASTVQYVLGAEYLSDDMEYTPESPAIGVYLTVNLKNGHVVKN